MYYASFHYVFMHECLNTYDLETRVEPLWLIITHLNHTMAYHSTIYILTMHCNICLIYSKPGVALLIETI